MAHLSAAEIAALKGEPPKGKSKPDKVEFEAGEEGAIQQDPVIYEKARHSKFSAARGRHASGTGNTGLVCSRVRAMMKNDQKNLLLEEAARLGFRYLDGLDGRPAFPAPAAVAGLEAFDEPFPAMSSDALETLALLDKAGSPATVATAGGRYFGFVIGGSLSAALAANWLAGSWDQNAGLAAASPVAARLEAVALRWLLDALSLPADAGGGFVSGATMANFSGLAAARHAILWRIGWDVEAHGLFGAPPITVVVGEEVHVSLLKALSLLGLGRERVLRVPVDGQGRMCPEALPRITGPTIICIQAGNVTPVRSTRQMRSVASLIRRAPGCMSMAPLACGPRQLPHGNIWSLEWIKPNSWATDAHKWLNVPYDCGLVFCRQAGDLQAALTHNAASYLVGGGQREPMEYTPEMSRRARGVEVWAALRVLGRSGLADMVERCCRHRRALPKG